MAEVRISDMTSHSTGVLAATDLIEVSEDLGGGLYGSRKLTGLQLNKGVKVYKAILTQVSTSDPTVSLLEDTIGITTVLRVGVGQYEITATGLFTSATKVFITTSPLKTITKEVRVYRLNTNVVQVDTYSSGSLADAVLASTEPLSLLIEVHP